MIPDIDNSRWNPVWLAGALTSAISAVVMVGWFIQSRSLVQIHPGFAPMQFNTALCHFLDGVALMALSQRRYVAVRWLAGLVIAVSGVTLFQYVSGWNVGVDQLFMRPFIADRSQFPGRMAPNSAVAFVLAGFALWIAVRSRLRQHVSIAPPALGLTVCVMAVVSLLSYAFVTDPYFLGGLNLIGMAVHTAFIFLLTGIGLMFAHWRLPEARTEMDVRQFGRSVLLYSLSTTLVTLAVCDILLLAPVWGGIRNVANEGLMQFGLLAALAVVVLGMVGLNRVLQPLIRRLVSQGDALAQQVAQTRAAMKRVQEESESRLAAEQTARLNETRYRALVEATQTAIWFTDAEGRISQPMPSWARFTGQTWDEYRGLGAFGAIHAEDLPRVEEEWTHAVRSGTFSSQYRLRNVDGTYHHVQSRGIALRDEQGQIKEWIGSVYDIQRIKDAEEDLRVLNADLENRVRVRTEQLAHSNRELEQFAYAASHDLKSPLRSIASFASLLRRRYDDTLPDTARDFIELIRESALQGQSLVDDMLELSRVQLDQAPPHARVSLDRVLDTVLEELAPDITSRGATIHRESLPEVCGDAIQLGRVLKNLILNAMLFQPRGKPDHHAQIWVGADREGTSWRLRVRDNGIGITPEDQGGLFRMFKRLHTQEQYPGSGIGLALCAKIVHRHGGRIWVESRPAQGSTFFLTLPDATSAACESCEEKTRCAAAR